MIEGDRIMHNGQATQLLPQLQQKLNPGDTVVCVANVAQNPNLANVLHHDSINSCFPTKPEKMYYRGGESLPMYGEINGWSPAGAYTCRMIRAVAKVQVQLGPSFTSVISDFNAQNVAWSIYYVSPAGFVQPKSTLAGFPGELTIPPHGNTNGTPYTYLLQRSGATEANTTFYIYEFQSSIHKITDTIIPIEINKFNRDRPCLILQKQYGIEAGGHWRLDFYDHAKSEFLDLKRNHHYLFTINKVNSMPYQGGLYNALFRPGSNIEYTIHVDGGMQYITANGQYAIATSVDTVWISGDVEDKAVTTYRVIIAKEMTGASWMGVGGGVKVESVYPSNAKLEITAPISVNPQTNEITHPMSPVTTQTLRITTENLTEGVLLFSTGNLLHRLHVKRRPQP
jgi:hypothetical protein